MVPGRKFCTSTSVCATSLASTSRPSSLLMSIDSERLPRFEEMNRAENSPDLSMVARLRRVMSPPIGSILRTSAPWSARNIVANGPDTTPVKSRTRTPLSGPDMCFSLDSPAAGSGRPAMFWLRSSGDLRAARADLLDDRVLDVAELILAEKHLLAHKKRRRAKRPALDRIGGVFNQLLLDIVLLGARDQPVDVDARRLAGAAEYLDVVHLLRFFPHVVVGGLEVVLEHVFEFRRDHAAHQHQRVDGEELILPEGRNVVPANEPLSLERLVFRLVLDPAERIRRRHVSGRLVNSAEQHRDILELHAVAPFDGWKNLFRQIGIGAAEIELKFKSDGACHPASPCESVVAGRRHCRGHRLDIIVGATLKF